MFISFTKFAQRKSLQLSASSVVQISQVLHSFRFLGGRSRPLATRLWYCSVAKAIISG
jgi:hypothetical protein